jgi:hypothetical protein
MGCIVGYSLLDHKRNEDSKNNLKSISSQKEISIIQAKKLLNQVSGLEDITCPKNSLTVTLLEDEIPANHYRDY